MKRKIFLELDLNLYLYLKKEALKRKISINKLLKDLFNIN